MTLKFSLQPWETRKAVYTHAHRNIETCAALMRAEDERTRRHLAVGELLTSASINVVAITNRITGAAVSAFGRYGKGTKHPDRLNMRDCFSYACAHAWRRALLFKGSDFEQTDVRRAMEFQFSGKRAR